MCGRKIKGAFDGKLARDSVFCLGGIDKTKDRRNKYVPASDVQYFELNMFLRCTEFDHPVYRNCGRNLQK